MMKNMKRHTKPVISIVLALVLIVSTVAVGIIATNAAYLNGKPKSAEAANAEADVADANAVGAKANDTASVGAKAPEAVGANADSEKVGTKGWYVTDKNGSVLGDNIHDKDFTFSVTSTMLNGNDVYIKITDENGNKYGNNNSVGYGESITAPQNDNHCVKLTNAKNYSSITLHIKYNGSSGNNTCLVNWKSGTSTSYSISYNPPTNGSFTTAPDSANSGSTVTVVATPATGYQVSSVTYTPDGGNAEACTHTSGNTYTFTMPSANVTVNASFTQANYTVSASTTDCTVTGLSASYHYGDTVTFALSYTDDYALKSMTVKQGTTNIAVTNTGGKNYSFEMPAGNVVITATCATTSGTAAIYFKSATAWVYQPFISINGGAEQKMTMDDLLENGAKSNKVKPKSDTGSLRYAWYKVDLTGVDTSKPVTITVRGQDTYMEATGTFTINSGDSLYLACDNLMEGSELVNISGLDSVARDFYDTPLNMIDN